MCHMTFIFTDSPTTLEENDSLISIPSEDEIREVVNSMGSLKVPSLDGVQKLFYQFFF